jgi:hypothetical protein
LPACILSCMQIVLKLWNAHLSDLPSDFAYRVRHALRRCSRKSGAQAPLLLSLAAREGCIVVVLEVGELGSSTSSTAAGTTSQDTSGAASTPASSSTVSVAFAQALVKQVMKELQRTGVRPADGHTAYIQVCSSNHQQQPAMKSIRRGAEAATITQPACLFTTPAGWRPDVCCRVPIKYRRVAGNLLTCCRLGTCQRAGRMCGDSVSSYCQGCASCPASGR